ncbi:MAG TPA: hypothetical protein VMU90_12890 [Solirubrobacteraceae bacterium]|nr:hypothetical protein [Solirubrobacteraceae bacterium]
MPESPLAPLAYLDVLLVVVAAPIMLLIGVPAVGYGVGAGAWLVLRAAGVGMERAIGGARDPRMQISIRMGYMLGRLFLLALAVVVTRTSGSKNDGLAALVVIVVAFTVQLATSAVTRPRGRSR